MFCKRSAPLSLSTFAMSSDLSLSLEPPRLFAGDGLDDDLFARPARLQDLNLEDGREVLTR